EVLPEMPEALGENGLVLPGLGQDDRSLHHGGEVLGHAPGAPLRLRDVLRLRLVEVALEAGGALVEARRAHRSNLRMGPGQFLNESSQQTALGRHWTARHLAEEIDEAEHPGEGVLLLAKRRRLELLLLGGVESFREHPPQVLLAVEIMEKASLG